jgi:protein LTV1
MVFQELPPTQAHKVKNRSDLESELFGGSDAGSEGKWDVRDNEGEAAEYGIYYDDTQYDYMQHMRDLGSGGGDAESYFVEASAKKQKGKGKQVSLEDALKDMDLQDTKSVAGFGVGRAKLLDQDILPSKNLRRTTYQDQQDVPDALAGFQPDMDPRLREVLEALEDDAYVDDDEDIFGELSKEKEEISLDEFQELGYDGEDGFEDEGWESDTTEKPRKEYRDDINTLKTVPDQSDIPQGTGEDHGDGDWMAEFSKFKQDSKAAKLKKPAAPSQAEIASSLISGASMMSGRKKKRKGAKTSTSGYSMTSSSIYRTEGLTLLDARFDRIEEEYNDEDMLYGEDDDGTASIMTGQMSNISGMSKMSGMSRLSTTSSQAPQLVERKDFNDIMDDFLGNYSMSGKKRVKKGGYQSGMEQLDEIRRELGRPKLPQTAK